jgi:hypothetical protein
MKWTLEGFHNGLDFSSVYARRSLPVLVSRGEQYRGVPENEIPEFTYGDLAEIVADRNYAHPMHYALGSIGYALDELNTKPEWKSRKIPPIQLMVWSAGHGSPGDDAFSFIGISKQQVSQMPAAARQATARSVRSTILAYPYWRDVLTATCVCVEVKSRISSEEDLIRGIFQCVKYGAVLDAQERYELMRDKKHVARTLRVALVTECSLSPELRSLFRTSQTIGRPHSTRSAETIPADSGLPQMRTDRSTIQAPYRL